MAELPYNQSSARSGTRQAAATLPPQQQPARVKLQPWEHKAATDRDRPVLSHHLFPSPHRINSSNIASIVLQYKSGHLTHPTALAWTEFGLSR